MTFTELLAWQWNLYPDGHRNRANLLLHIVAVPLFELATLIALYGILTLDLGALVLGIAGVGLSLFLQGRGHKLESVPPVPFDSPLHFLRRIVAEQWITFPRFVLTGGWYTNLQAAAKV
jgi:hypothetical protein